MTLSCRHAIMADYINISAFLIGISTAFFTVFALHILFWRKGRTRFQTVLGCIMAVWAVWNLKDMVLTFPGMYTDEVLNWIFIIDAWSALSYTVFVFEVVMPRWTTVSRLALLSLPFALFTLLYYIWPERWVIYAYVAFLWFFAWTVVIIGWVKVRQHIKYVRANFSNIDRIDVAWLKSVFVFSVVSQLAWLFTSLCANVLIDIAYYISVIALWLMVLYYSWDFRPITIEDNANPERTANNKNELPFAEGALEQLMDEQKLYLKKDLTLADLAEALGTNRTYVSKYISQVLNQTFYDYVNQLRIERVSLPMMREHPEFKLDFVAHESGFASISTFRRAFIKLTGQTPRQYALEANQETGNGY